MNGRSKTFRVAMCALVVIGACITGSVQGRDDSKALPAAVSQETALKGWDRYAVLIDRNIFSQKRKPAPTPEQIASANARKNQEEANSNANSPEARITARDLGFVLCGVAIQDGVPVAFVEDRKAGKTLRLVDDQKVGSGRFISITLGGVVYEVEGKQRELKVGQALTGDVASASTATTTAAANGAPATPGAAAGNSGELSVLERMKLKRESELGR